MIRVCLNIWLERGDYIHKNTIISVVKYDLCTGCGTCVAMCQANAITLSLDRRKGIYKPLLDENRCNNCGICIKVCPGKEVDFNALNIEVFGKDAQDNLIGNYISCYYGYSTDYNIRRDCASGGLVTQLLVYALDEGIIDGALVTRMKKDKPLEPEPFIARSREEIIEASKSKYCPVPANVALKEILDTDGRYAVVGLPCHIHGIKKAEMVNNKLKQRIVLCLGIWCSTTCSFLATDFVLKRIGVCKGNVKKIDYRGEGWPGGMSIDLNDGTKKFIKQQDYWDDNFESFSPRRCRLCCDASAELADVSFGDYRGHSMHLNESIGVSGIISRTEKGEDILDRMSSNKIINIWAISRSDVASLQHYFDFKKYVRARFCILNFVGQKVPHYYLKLPSPPITSYILEVLYNSPRSFFASKPYLWWALEILTFTYKSLLRLLFKRGSPK